MDAQELLVHNRRQRQATERLHAGLVDGLRVLVLALQLESEVVGQVATLMVAAQQPQRVGVVDLERPEVENAFDAEVAAVDVVAQEEIPRLGRVAADLEQLHQVVVLAVHVTAHCDGGIHLEQVGLLAQQFGTLADDPERLLLGQAALAVEVLLEELDVGERLCLRVLPELLVGRLVHGRCLYVYWRLAVSMAHRQKFRGKKKNDAILRRTFDNALQRADLGAVLHGVDGEVDLRRRLLVANGTNGIVNLEVAAVVEGCRRVVVFAVHGWR